MKVFIEKFKDFIYNSIDYFIIIAIIVSVVFIIGWRLDILFAKDTLDTPPPIVIDDTDIDDDKNDEDLLVTNPDLPNDDNEEPPEDPDIVDKPSIEDPDSEPTTTITITIPDGTLPSGIGTILETNGLINSKNDFVIQAQSMELDRRLRSGTFNIPSNSSLEEIIKIIAHQN